MKIEHLESEFFGPDKDHKTIHSYYHEKTETTKNKLDKTFTELYSLMANFDTF